MRCTATIEIADRRGVWCDDHDWLAELPHGSSAYELRWSDGTPGAAPHQEPRYVARHKGLSGEWQVIDTEHGLAAAYVEEVHPDPQGAAEAEARRLSCGAHDQDQSLHGAWVCDGCGVEVEATGWPREALLVPERARSGDLETARLTAELKRTREALDRLTRSVIARGD